MSVRVLLDVDGVIANFVGWYHEIAEAVLGRYLEVSGPTHWDIGVQLGLDKAERDLVWDAICHTPAVDIKPYPESLEPVRILLSDTRVSVYFVTASLVGNPTWEYDRRAWFREQFDDEASRRLVFTDRKHVVSGDIFVDDKAESVHSWVRCNLDGLGVVWAREWNEGQELDKFRTNRWGDLLGLVRNLL